MHLTAQEHHLLNHPPFCSDYNQAVKLAKIYDKPLALVFIGSDWNNHSANWLEECQKKAFQDKTKNNFIFVILDYKELNSQKTNIIQANYTLMQSYHAHHLPQLVLLTPDEKEITRIGDVPSLTTQLDHLMQYSHVYWQLEKMNSSFNEKQMYALYQSIKQLGCNTLGEKFVKKLPLEKLPSNALVDLYQQAKQAKKNSLVQQIKEVIHSKQLPKEYEVQLAMIDYQNSLIKGSHEAIANVEKTTQKLKNQNIKGLWQLHLILSEAYREKKELKKAKEEALISYEMANQLAQKNIEKIIHQIDQEMVEESSTVSSEGSL